MEPAITRIDPYTKDTSVCDQASWIDPDETDLNADLSQGTRDQQRIPIRFFVQPASHHGDLRPGRAFD